MRVKISWAYLRKPYTPEVTACNVEIFSPDGEKIESAHAEACLAEGDRFEKAIGRLLSYKRALPQLSKEAQRACGEWVKKRRVHFRESAPDVRVDAKAIPIVVTLNGDDIGRVVVERTPAGSFRIAERGRDA